MSDVLFRGPIEVRHGDDMDRRLHASWRRVRATIGDSEAYMRVIVDFRVSAVQVAMMLETARPPEAAQMDGSYELPDARCLASLLSLRCDKDDEEELHEMYRLVCQKLQGERCMRCAEALDEHSAAGLFDGSSLIVPSCVPKVLVPQCGHAVHTLCFASQLLPENSAGARGLCRRCGFSYAWTSIDIDPMVSAFCLLFGSYVDKRATEMAAEGQIARSDILRIAEICQNFSLELGGLIVPSAAWAMLSRRHAFECPPDAINVISECILDILMPPPQTVEELPLEPDAPLGHTAVVAPEDRFDDDSLSDMSEGFQEHRKHVTEVFLPDVDSQSDAGFSEAAGSECAEGDGDGFSPIDLLPPLALPPCV